MIVAGRIGKQPWTDLKTQFYRLYVFQFRAGLRADACARLPGSALPAWRRAYACGYVEDQGTGSRGELSSELPPANRVYKDPENIYSLLNIRL